MAAICNTASVMNHEQPRSLHPFFQKPGSSPRPSHSQILIIPGGTPCQLHGQSPAQVEGIAEDSEGQNVEPCTKTNAKPKPRTRAAIDLRADQSQRRSGRDTNRIPIYYHTTHPYDDAGTEPIVQEIDNFGRKRRRLSPLDDHNPTLPKQQGKGAAGQRMQDEDSHRHVGAPTDTNELNDVENVNGAQPQPSKDDIQHGSMLPDVPTASDQQSTGIASSSKPRNVLKLNGSGGFGSPEDKKKAKDGLNQLATNEAKLARRGRRKKQLLITFLYRQGNEAVELGEKINQILLGTNKLPVKSTPRAAVLPLPVPMGAVNPDKPSHPFFTGKPRAPSKERKGKHQVASAPVSVPPRVTTTSTPARLRAQRRQEQAVKDETPEQDIIYEPKSDRVFRVPGTVDAAWPSKGLTKVSPPLIPTQPASAKLHFGRTRGKNRAVHVDEEENLLSQYALTIAEFAISAEFQYKTRSSLQIDTPRRLILSGKSLSAKLLEKLYPNAGDQKTVKHPALRKMFEVISTGQSAFDQGRHEGQQWAHKYVPKSTAEVLQAEREMQIIKGWLESQTVSSTNVLARTQGNMLKALHRPKDELKKQRRKRRKVADELDGFIVGSDDEGGALRDLSDDEVSIVSTEPNMRSLVQEAVGAPGKGAPKTANAILISGPLGCGKTAAVFAVAKELDFEVFEIGPGSRRSGKEILDRVGDMALNHQVSRASNSMIDVLVQADVDPTVEADFSSTQPARDQSTLASFFGDERKKKPKKVSTPKAPPVPIPVLQAHDGQLFKENKRQKQSLILLEEVDILFEQDRQFWETVLDLAQQSRRPIVMTCNDESLVPLGDMSLHALLRFRQPSDALVTDYLVLLAAAEGHLVSREAISSLFKARRRDLRATIMELNFWCQMALADPKGGLNWYLPHWPAGADLDERGDKLRVVSLGTYRKSLGFVGIHQSSADTSLARDEDLSNQVWAEWSIDPSRLSTELFETTSNSEDAEAFGHSKARNLKRLREMDSCLDMMSAADLICSVDTPSTPLIQEVLDPAHHPLPESKRGDFIEGHSLLQASRLVDYQQLDTQISISLHLGLRKCFYRYLPAQDRFVEPQQGGTLATLINQIHNPAPDEGAELMSNAKDLVRALSFTTEPAFNAFNSKLIAAETAPYARSIAEFDRALEQMRAEQGGQNRRIRTTRASRSALEGGIRAQTRKERWFGKDVDLELILGTAGRKWPAQLVTAQDNSTQSSREESTDELG